MNYRDRFIGAYLECALWAESDQSEPNGGYPLERSYGVDDIAPESRAKAERDCEAFIAQAGELLDALEAEQAGHDLWLTRNGHGTGYWDRDLGETGDALANLARAMGEAHAIPSDGRVWID